MQNDQILPRRERIRDRSFVSNRKKEVLCFLRAEKFAMKEKGLLVSVRNWRFWWFAAQGVAAGTAGWGVLDRLGALVVIFTDSSSSCGARNAKGCVCSGSCRPGKGAAFEPVRQSARQYI
jgi:hypothetical protein